MKRDEICRTDFPRARKGYDPQAVDEHLRAIAAALGKAKSGTVRGPLAGRAGEKVMDILDLVERTAAEIVEEADRQAAAVVADAEKRMRAHLERAESALDELAKAAAEMRASAVDVGAQVDAEIRSTIDVAKVTEIAGRERDEAAQERDAA